MIFNVSTLLEEPIGGARAFEVTDEQVRVPEEGYETRVSGTVELVRTPRGVVVRAQLAVRPRLQCGRCLAEFEQALTLDVYEEFVTDRDLITGEPVEGISPDDFRIDDYRHLDLSEAVRQYEQAALPLRPLCRDECAGLCPTCGRDLNERACGCSRDEVKHRWSGLAGLAEQLRSEESDGRTEA